MIAATLIGIAAASSLILATAARRRSLVATLLLAYLAYVGNLGIVTLVLSPLREVTRGGIAVVELAVLGASLAIWWEQGRPAIPLASAWASLREVACDPLSTLFGLGVGALLSYELLLALVAPVIRWDSLSYHLTRAAAWAQHGGLYWITNAPDVRLNAFQPLAEQQILFLFVATGRGALSSLPQYLAELAILLACYGAARRLGHGVRPAACGAFLFATFSLVAFESTTADNDLVAASLPAVAVYFLLGADLLEPLYAGVAAGFALGVKLTTALVLPIVVWLALARGRRTLALTVGGGAIGFVALGIWGYALNAIHTGHVLGSGTGSWEDRAAPGYPRSLANAFDYVYGLMDLSSLSNGTIELLALGGVIAAATTFVLRRGGVSRRLSGAAAVTTPLIAPAVVLGTGAAIAFAAGHLGVPIRGPNGAVSALDNGLDEVFTRIDNENYAAFGPLGIIAIVVASATVVWTGVTRRGDRRQLALAAALPLFVVLMSLSTQWTPYLMRFMLVPAAVAAPLLATLFHGRATTAAYFGVAALTVGVTVVHDQARPLASPDGPPWHVSQVQAFTLDFQSDLGQTVQQYARLVPPRACVGAVLDANEPSYVLFGPKLEHRVDFLPVATALEAADSAGLTYVVITTGTDSWATTSFQQAGWRIRPLAAYWQLATAPHPGPGSCIL